MVKKIKKLKKKKSKNVKATTSVGHGQNGVDKAKYDQLKRRHLALVRKYKALEKAYERIHVVEEDIKKVHEKLDSLDTDREDTDLLLKDIKVKVGSITTKVSNMEGLAIKMSKAYGVKVPRAAKPLKGDVRSVKRKQMGPLRQSLGPKTPKRKSGTMPKAETISGSRNSTSANPSTDRVSKGSNGALEEISVSPEDKGNLPAKKDLKALADKMYEADVISDEDNDTMDYLVKEHGKQRPLSKKKVETIIKDRKGDE